LDFSELESISSTIRIELFDAFTGATADIRTASSYTFQVTADSTSYGDRRFELRFSPATRQSVEITATGSTLSSSYAAGNQWYLNGELLPGATQQSLEVGESGIYEVKVTFGGCSLSASREMTVTDAEVVNSIKGMELYPNPVANKFIVRIPNKGPANSEIRSALGQPLGSVKFVPDGDKLKGEFDLGGYPSGLYLLEITQGYKTTNHKVIKK
jgi:hypothetical protein